jgi:tubulin-specific chaperone A
MGEINNAAVIENDSVLKPLKIKLGVCKRMIKEVEYYKKEVKENEEIISRLIHEGIEDLQLKQPRKCLEESYAMVPESSARLQTSMDELYIYLVRSGDEEILSSGEGLRIKLEAETLVEADAFHG